MAIKFNKNNKVIESKTKAPGKLCSVTLVIQCVLTLVLGFIAFAPFLAGFGAFCLSVVLIVAAVLVTGVTAGVIWTSTGVQSFFRKGFSIVRDAYDDPAKIIEFFKPNLLAIALPIFFVSAIGFVYNLIYFIKNEKANKARFIASCVILGVALFNLIFALVFYLTYKK